MIWFTSDQHYGHTNIISYCKRPFIGVTFMNEALIKNYQALVKPDDEVYFLGDVAFCDPTPIVHRLPGRKHLIMGNHDERRKAQLHRLPFQWIKDRALIEIENQWIFLDHFPHLMWPRAGDNRVWHLHGHAHGCIKNPVPFSLDVGVDCWDYAPVSYDAIKERFRLTVATAQPPA